ncbi:MAG TPA: lactonase family protein, partial [Polyangia bacterium]
PPAPVSAAPEGARQPFVYVAGYRPEIRVFRLDVDAAQLAPVTTVEAGKSPSFLAIDPQGRFLVAIDEISEGRVTSFRIDAATGGLARVNEVASGGFGPAHVSLDRSARWVLVANYAGSRPGTIAVLPISAEGRVGEVVDRHDYGPDAMPHYIGADLSNRFVFVPVKGGPFVGQQRFDANTGQIENAAPDRVPSAPRAAPRHLDFHPNGRFVYVINEAALTITAYTLDPERGLTEIETLSTMPADVVERKGFSTADIHVHPSGRWLYGSNRGHNTIVQFAIDQETGRLTLVGHEGRTIKTPRNFHIEPSGRLLLAANQGDASVSVFRIDPASGRLELAGTPTPAGEKPSFVGVVLLKGS